MGTLGSFLRVERTKLEADHSSSTPRLTMSAATSLCPAQVFTVWKRAFIAFYHSCRHARIQHKEYDTEPAIHGPYRYDVSTGRLVVQSQWGSSLVHTKAPYGPTTYQQLTTAGWVIMVERYMVLLKPKFSAKKPFPLSISLPQTTRRLSWEQIPASLKLGACRLRFVTASLCET